MHMDTKMKLVSQIKKEEKIDRSIRMKRKKENRADKVLISAKYFLRGFYDLHHFYIALPFFICISAAAAGLLAMVLPKIVLDAVEQGMAADKLFLSVGCVGALFAAASLATMLLRNELELVSQNFLYTELTARWERGMLRMDYEAFVSQRGKILAEKARNAISSPNWGAVKFLPGLSAILEAFLGLLVCLGIVGTLHPGIFLILLLLFAVQLWFSGYTQKEKQSLKEVRATADRRLNYLAWGMRGEKEGKDIRLYAFDALLHRIAQKTIRAKQEVEGKVERMEFYNMLFAALLLLLRDGMAYFYLIWKFLHSEMTLGDFTLYFAAITGVGGGLLKLARAISDFLETARYAEDFFEFIQYSMQTQRDEKSIRGEKYLAASEKTKQAENSITELNDKETVSFVFENVSFSYFVERDGKAQEIPVIKNLNLKILPGESIAIVGVNGAGKSTFVKLLCGLLTPSEGRILVNGMDSRLFRREDYFKLFSAVFQKSGFLPVSIAENIMLNVKRKGAGEQNTADSEYEEGDIKAMWECIRRAGLEEKVKTLPRGVDTCLVKQIAQDGTELSGGQAQKLLLTRALYKDAPVLVLDEPTAALDPLAEHEIYQDYQQMTRGKTSVFISHRLASTRFCDRILLFSDGRILESGTHKELLALGGQYAKMFEVQSRYYQEEENRKDGVRE